MEIITCFSTCSHTGIGLDLKADVRFDDQYFGFRPGADVHL
jgi:hypothetical protein